MKNSIKICIVGVMLTFVMIFNNSVIKVEARNILNEGNIPNDSDVEVNSVPSGFAVISSNTGVKLYKKDYTDGEPDYVQVVSLNQGAKVKLMTGATASLNSGTGPYGGNNASFYRTSLSTAWNSFLSTDSNAFCITNGQFFSTNSDPTKLAFPLKKDGQILSDGYGSTTEYPGQLLMLELWTDHADIKTLTKDNLYNSSAPNILGGLTEDADKGVYTYTGRTFVGIDDADGNGTYETVLVFSSSYSRQVNAASVLRGFGADKIIMFDGGGSTQLKCGATNYISSSRTIPQTIGVIAGNSQSTCPGTTATQAYVCTPSLTPAYTTSCGSWWYPFTGFNGNTAYLTENAKDSSTSSNSGKWTPNIQTAGKYKVEAYIAHHDPFNVSCSWGTATLNADTSNAHYLIHSAAGDTTVIGNQLPLDNQWLNLGEFNFNVGTGGYVTLSDLTGETRLSTNPSFSAMRFTLVEDTSNPAPTISTITPTAVEAGGGSFTLTVNGSGFVSGSVVRWKGSARSTSYINSTQVTATISASDISGVNSASVTVYNPTPGGGTSNAVEFDVYTFADALPDAWYWKWVEGFYAQGITTGCAAGPLQYCPDRAVTRAEMAVFLLRAKEGLSTPTPSQSGMFADVPVSGKEWMKPWIEEFYVEGITTGCGASPLQYCPEREVTRAEMAVFVLRAKHGASYQPPAGTGIFSDVPVSGKEWMEAWVEEFYNEGITTGCAASPLRYCPEQSVTRAEMATFIDRAFGYSQLPEY